MIVKLGYSPNLFFKPLEFYLVLPVFMKQYFLFFLVFFSSSIQVFSQVLTITGKVSDTHTEEPLPYSSVYIKGTTIGTTTDDNGNYTLQLSIKADTLVFSSVGYTTLKKVIPAGSQLIMNASLDRTNYSLAVAMIYAGEDPAITIFKKVQKNKSHNNNIDNNNFLKLKLHTSLAQF